jgi:hypothetical protein
VPPSSRRTARKTGQRLYSGRKSNGVVLSNGVAARVDYGFAVGLAK